MLSLAVRAVANAVDLGCRSVPLIALDFDGTLVDQASAARAWAIGFVEDWGLAPVEVGTMTAALMARRSKDEVFSLLIDRLEIPTTADEVWQDYRSRMPSLVTVADADRRALAKLRSAGWTLGRHSHQWHGGQPGQQDPAYWPRRPCSRLGCIRDGRCKEAPACDLRGTRSRLGCALDGWMIGDSLELDVAGGAAVGLRTAWIDRDGCNTAGYQPDLTVDSVATAVRTILHSRRYPSLAAD